MPEDGAISLHIIQAIQKHHAFDVIYCRTARHFTKGSFPDPQLLFMHQNYFSMKQKFKYKNSE